MPTGTGTIIFFNDEKGYGFIKVKDSSTNVFVHMDDVDGEDLTEGEVVDFDIEQGQPLPTIIGIRATNVKRVDADDSESSEEE